MDYSGTMRRGWEIVWRNKWLFVLGFVPMLTGVVSLLSSSIVGLPTDPSELTPEMVSGLMGRLAFLNCINLILVLAFFIVSLAARGGIIAGVAGVERGESYSFGRAFRDGWNKILQLLGMTILLYGALFLVMIVLLAVVVVPIFIIGVGAASGDAEGLMNSMSTLTLLAVCCLTLFAVLLSLFLGFVYPFSFRGIVLREMGVIESIRHGWRVLRGNLGEILLLALPFFVLTMILFGLYGIAYVALVFPTMMEGLTSPEFATGFSISPAFIVMYILYALVAAVLATWQSATFTLAYFQWTGKDILRTSPPPVEPPPADPFIG